MDKKSNVDCVRLEVLLEFSKFHILGEKKSKFKKAFLLLVDLRVRKTAAAVFISFSLLRIALILDIQRNYLEPQEY